MVFEEILVPLLTFVIFFACGFLIRKLLLKTLIEWSKTSKSKIDDILINSIRFPVVVWWLMLSIFFALKVSHLPDDIVLFFNKLILVVSVTSVTFVAAGIAGKLIKLYSANNKDATIGITSLTHNVAKAAIFTCGGLILLSGLGISIAPMLTALGVGGLAVALALQDTLSNFFSGLGITLAKQIRIGDYIKLESGQEGYVSDINWRSTKIKMLSNNIVIIPNTKITQAIVTNYHLPDKEVMVTLDLGVHYNSDLAYVEKVTLDVAQEVVKDVAQAVAGFEPLMHYHSFGESSIGFTVIFRVQDINAQGILKHEFIKRLHKRFKKEGMVIPYPIRAINYAQEKAVS